MTWDRNSLACSCIAYAAIRRMKWLGCPLVLDAHQHRQQQQQQSQGCRPASKCSTWRHGAIESVIRPHEGLRESMEYGRRTGGQVSEKQAQDRLERRACAGTGQRHPLVAPLVRMVVGDSTAWLVDVLLVDGSSRQAGL